MKPLGLQHYLFLQFQEEGVFEFSYAFLGSQDFFFKFLKFLSDVTFCIDQSLFSDVVLRNGIFMDIADFHVVSEDFVETDFQGWNTGTLSFPHQHLIQELFRVL